MLRYKEQNVVNVPRFHDKNGFYTTEARSRLMSRIKGKDTTPETMLRKALWKEGIRYVKNVSSLPGNPDIVIKKHKLVVFVDGEFWHGYNWEAKKLRIKSNRGFWIPKIERNIQRDKENNLLLQAMGYTVLRFWGNDVKKNIGRCMYQVLLEIGE